MYIISVDGVDCVGKSTYCIKLFNNKIEKGYRPKLIHFPRYNTRVGKLAWEELHTEFPSVDRVQALCLEDFCNFHKELEDNKYKDFDTIIMDRSIISTLAYNTDNLKKRFIGTLINKKRVTVPNKSIVLIPSSMDIIKDRLHAKDNTDGFEEIGHLARVNDKFLSILKQYDNRFNFIVKEVE